MQNICEMLWYGNIDPQEKCCAGVPEIQELQNLMRKNRDKLQKNMTAEQLETLEKYDNCIDEMHEVLELKIFSYGFQLGGQLMLAMLADNMGQYMG